MWMKSIRKTNIEKWICVNVGICDLWTAKQKWREKAKKIWNCFHINPFSLLITVPNQWNNERKNQILILIPISLWFVLIPLVSCWMSCIRELIFKHITYDLILILILGIDCDVGSSFSQKFCVVGNCISDSHTHTHTHITNKIIIFISFETWYIAWSKSIHSESISRFS